MLIILGHVLARSDTIEQATQLAREHVQRSRREPGCLSYDVHVDLDNPLRLVFVERWADGAALQAHFRVPESVAFARDMARLGAAPPEMAVHEATVLPLTLGATR